MKKIVKYAEKFQIAIVVILLLHLVVSLAKLGVLLARGSSLDEDSVAPSIAAKGKIMSDSSQSITLQELKSMKIETTRDAAEPPVVEELSRYFTEDDVIAIARTLYGECRGVPSTKEKAAVVWTILNRLDAGYSKSIIGVVSAPYQFIGYSPYHPVTDELYNLAEDVLLRWSREKSGEVDVGRILPADYVYFSGDGAHNYFRNTYRLGNNWNWSLPSPYEN